ncbi:MAG: uracil-DNA glycosylase family protein [Pseudomonadota bacterium]
MEAADQRQQRLAEEIGSCRICSERFLDTETRHEPRPVLVLSRTARVLIVGQAPGARVHASGMPFDDPSGDRLRSWMGIGRETFYDPSKLAIVPMGFCFPGYDARGADLPPPKICAQTWRDQVMGTLRHVELTLVIGQYAQAWHLGRARGKSVTETVRAWRVHVEEGVLPLPHPSWRNTAWLKKNPWFEEEVVPWLRGAVGRLCF